MLDTGGSARRALGRQCGMRRPAVLRAVLGELTLAHRSLPGHPRLTGRRPGSRKHYR